LGGTRRKGSIPFLSEGKTGMGPGTYSIRQWGEGNHMCHIRGCCGGGRANHYPFFIRREDVWLSLYVAHWRGNGCYDRLSREGKKTWIQYDLIAQWGRGGLGPIPRLVIWGKNDNIPCRTEGEKGIYTTYSSKGQEHKTPYGWWALLEEDWEKRKDEEKDDRWKSPPPRKKKGPTYPAKDATEVFAGKRDQ